MITGLLQSLANRLFSANDQHLLADCVQSKSETFVHGLKPRQKVLQRVV